MRHRRALVFVAVLAVVAVGVPAVIAADPPSPAPTESEKPGKGPRDQAARGPKVEVTLTGTIEQATDTKGRPTFTLTSGGTTWELSAGPKWFHGTGGGPLAAYVGDTVEVHGWHREGSTDVSVDTVNGTRVIPEGRPPWAGGPKANGERHPGWKAWHADGKPGRGHGRDGAPGQLKDKPADDEAPAGD